ncbi:MAG: hypothetical protein JWO91_1415 [Acidobacteriaceae bacterium]|nr:hypothetical protein [Acidobacteriaceae bacterium]
MELPLKHCEIVLVRHLEDAMGYSCGAVSTEECAECGTSVCNLHAESCDHCGESLCASCFFRHVEEPHSKRPGFEYSCHCRT